MRIAFGQEYLVTEKDIKNS